MGFATVGYWGWGHEICERTVSIREKLNTFSRINDSVRWKVLLQIGGHVDWSWAYAMGMIRDHVGRKPTLKGGCGEKSGPPDPSRYRFPEQVSANEVAPCKSACCL